MQPSPDSLSSKENLVNTNGAGLYVGGNVESNTGHPRVSYPIGNRELSGLLMSKKPPALSEATGGVSGTRTRKYSSSYITEKHQDLWQSILEGLENLSPLTMPHDETEIMSGFEEINTMVKLFRNNAAFLTESLHTGGANAEAEKVKEQVLQVQRSLEEVRERYDIHTIGGSNARQSIDGSHVSRRSEVSTASQKARSLKGSLAAQLAKERFTVQVDELELQEKQMQIRLKRLGEGGERAGMEAELSVLEEEDAGGDRSLLDR